MEKLYKASFWAATRLGEWEEFDKRDIWGTGVAYDWLKLIHEKYEHLHEVIEGTIEQKRKELFPDKEKEALEQAALDYQCKVPGNTTRQYGCEMDVYLDIDVIEAFEAGANWMKERLENENLL